MTAGTLPHRYTGTVISLKLPPKQKQTALLEFDAFHTTDDDSSPLLTEIVPLTQLRPLPPQDSNASNLHPPPPPPDVDDLPPPPPPPPPGASADVIEEAAAAAAADAASRKEASRIVFETNLQSTFPVPSLYLPCTFPEPSLNLPQDRLRDQPAVHHA